MTNRQTHFEVSLYGSEQTEIGQTKAVGKIKKAFPSLPVGFYETLLDRVRDLKISDDRLIASINYVIDNCEYPTPTIAQFVKYDKKVKLLTYDQYTKAQDKKNYRAVKIGDLPKPMWASLNDIKQFNLKPFKNDT